MYISFFGYSGMRKHVFKKPITDNNGKDQGYIAYYMH